MDEDRIITDIKIILEAPSVASINSCFQYEHSFTGDGSFKYSHRGIDNLVALYMSLPSVKEKEFFKEILILNSFFPEKLPGGKPGKNFIQELLVKPDLTFVFLYKIGLTDEALGFFNGSISVTDRLARVINACQAFLKFEPEGFQNPQLDFLYNKIAFIVNECSAHEINERQPAHIRKQVPQLLRKTTIPAAKGVAASLLGNASGLLNLIKERRLSSLEERLADVSWEINQDQEKLKEKIRSYNFPEELISCLNAIDSEFLSENPFSLKSCIGHIRTFQQELCVSIAGEVETVTGIKPAESINGVGKAGAYFKNKGVGFLTEKEDAFIYSLYALASDEGTHALTSEREHARILKNVSVEAGLFLFGRLEKLANNDKS